ncbi:hypothetical protein [Marinobacter sp. bablab_jr008]|uniref:hypothetical protein n=1 Tax=Marinobacter sp. bablab_jr008 TaxID=2755064 RepID=UPI0018F17A51|nr:hypothetical protein [Marinobacter sp. bablab_jr008]
MKKTPSQELLTMLQAQHNGCSLYALHHILGVTDAAIYKIADGTSEMSTDTILIACDCLGVDPRPWLIRAELTRCRSPKRRQILTRILAELDTAETRAAVGFLAFFVVGFFGVLPV